MVHKNKTAFCPSLDPKGASSSLLTIKLLTIKLANRTSTQFESPKKTVKAAKSATTVYNKAHFKK